MTIVETGRFKSRRDILKLNVVDWNRLINYWDNIDEAVEAISSCLIGIADYSIIECDMNAAPQRDDWPGWNHVGTHEQMGYLFWNWFHWKKKGIIHFSDSPDFSGKLILPNYPATKFYGDIGLVSAPTFIRTLKIMDANEIWITVVDSHTQIVIEPQVSIRQLWMDLFKDIK